MIIKSTDNPKIKYINTLKKKSVRERDGLMLLEGQRLVCDSFEFGAEIDDIFIREDYESEIPPCKEVYKVSARVFDKIAETITPQGIIGIARIPRLEPNDIFDGHAVLCDSVRDPGNLGTIIRTAHACSAHVFLYGTCADPYSLKAARSSMGSVFAAKPVFCTEKDIRQLKLRGFRLISGMLHKTAKNLFETDLCGQTILAVGNEANGISDEIADLSDAFTVIPMPGGAESLNASVAASVMLYEQLRQTEKA